MRGLRRGVLARRQPLDRLEGRGEAIDLSEIQCFWIENTGRDRRFLRRYARSDQPCPVTGYHDAKVFLDEVPDDGEPIGDHWPHDDPRWPTACPCGYVFADEDHRQLFRDSVYRRTDTGEEVGLREAPAGAMWDANWMSRRGPDGINLVVRTPAGEWMVDGPASNSPDGWQRTGDPKTLPPTVTASPSIGIGDPMRYHGWLRDGKLVDA